MRQAFRFFHKNAGGIVGQAAIGAWLLAKAEEYAVTQDWQVIWDWDTFYHGSCDEWLGCPEGCKKEHEVLCCCVQDANGEVLASLCGIADADQSYARVVEAELKLEAMSNQLPATFGIGR